MYFRRGDPEIDFDLMDALDAAYHARLPKCENRRCQKCIDDDLYFEIDGEILCLDCVKEKYGQSTDDYAEGWQ